MKYFNLEVGEEQISMRLRSQDCTQIEKQYGVSLIEYVQQASVTTIVTLLKFMRRGTGETFTDNMAYEFYDKLVDEGYTIETMLDKIIWEALVVSGVISKEDLDNIRKEKEKLNEMTDEEKEKYIEERKNLKK